MDYYSKFLKYKNKYLSLKKMIGSAGWSSKKLVVCFDFDRTLTDIHTRGFPDLKKEYFDSPSEIKALLKDLSSKLCLYIVTRGMQEKVKEYLKSRGMLKYFKNVYGARSEKEVQQHNWEKIKVMYLNQILKEENIDKNHLYFYDDTKVNITEALKNGYINSFMAETPGVLLLDELNTYFNMNQISDMKPGKYKLIYKRSYRNIISRDALIKSSRGEIQKTYLLVRNCKFFYVMKHDLIGLNQLGDISLNDKKWDPTKPVFPDDIFDIKKVNLSLINNYFSDVTRGTKSPYVLISKD